MGRSKGKSQDTGGGGGGPSGPSSSSLPNNRASSLSPAPVISASSSTTSAQADTKIKDLKKELFGLIHNIQEERDRGQHNIVNIDKTHERMQQEARVTPYYKNKLRGLYNTAMQDAEAEAELLRKALDRITEIKSLKESKRQDSKQPKPIMRRGVLMTLLQQNATTLPLWVSKPGEKPPPLCGAVPADNNYVCNKNDKIAARVKSVDGEENWILASVVTFNSQTNKYEVDDIDAEEGKERHSISRRRIVPLPIYRANPETDPEALFPKGTLVLALYPQTTCFYRGLVDEPPKNHEDDYSVLFEDTSYPSGYSPPLMVAQRYVIACKEDKKK
ncbi:SAGA-associated factor 29-like [Littorina saxatilis]